MLDNYYIIGPRGGIRKEPDILKWGEWFETADRHLAEKWINGIWVSTIFLGLDHGWGSGPPVLWETMVFGGKDDQKICFRSSSPEGAMRHHEQCCNNIRKRFLKKHLHPDDQRARSQAMRKMPNHERSRSTAIRMLLKEAA